MSDTSLNRQMFKDQVFVEIAVTLGSLGTCSRAAVGAVITRDGRAISWGYNGAAPGLPHCAENNHGWATRQIMPEIEDWDTFLDVNGCINATHAEANALAFAARQGISTDGGTLYVERSPCEACSRLLIAAGVRRVVYRYAYRDAQGVELLRRAGVEVDQID